MGGRAGTFMDESISAVIDPVGEEGRELLSDDPPGIYMHCGARDSSFRIGSKSSAFTNSGRITATRMVSAAVNEEATTIAGAPQSCSSSSVMMIR